MKIHNIKIGGFKNIENVELNLDGIVTLVSLNSYGKSNLIRAIKVAFDFINQDSKTKNNIMSYRDFIPVNKKNDNMDFEFEIDFEHSVNCKTYYSKYGFNFKWIKDDKTGAVITKEQLKVKESFNSKKYNLLINRDLKNAFYRTSEKGRCSNKINIEKNELVINKLKAYDDLYYLDLVKSIDSLKASIEKHLDAGQYYSPDIVFRKIDDIWDEDNIPKKLYYLKKDNEGIFNLLINSFKKLFPNIENIDVKEFSTKGIIKEELTKDVPFILAENIYTIAVKEKNLNQLISFERMSDGAKRIFLMMIDILLLDKRGLSLIEIEEPENSIHPGLLRDFLNILEQLNEGCDNKCNIIMTSHSPYIINYLDLNYMYMGLPNGDGIANFYKIQNTKINTVKEKARKLDISRGEYLFNLMGGSADDISQLEYYLGVANK